MTWRCRTPDPCSAYSRQALASLTREIVEVRARIYPARVDAGRMTQAQADDGLRIARAHAALWAAVVGRGAVATTDPVRSLGASWAEMRDDCRRNAEAAAKDAAAHPNDPARAERAAQAATLAANLAPFSDTLPRPYIVVLYEGDRDARPHANRRAAA